jgi:CheY-like chemotaxis protein
MAVHPPRRTLVVDDEPMIRELLEILLARNDYIADHAQSGEEALTMLADGNQPHPSVILVDMQLRGISGSTLASQIHSLCDSNIRLIAMSASQPEEAQLEGFDAFLRKPFSEDKLIDVLEDDRLSASNPSVEPQTNPVLDRAVYEKLAGSMSLESLHHLYKLCLSDCQQRIDLLHQALQRGDEKEYRSQGHAIRGSCGMVGAAEMESLAGIVERDGLVATSMDTLTDLMSAWKRLEGIVGKREISVKVSNDKKGDEEKTI